MNWLVGVGVGTREGGRLVPVLCTLVGQLAGTLAGPLSVRWNLYTGYIYMPDTWYHLSTFLSLASACVRWADPRSGL